MGWEIVNLIHMAQHRDLWWGLMNMVKAFRFQKMLGISWVAEQLLASQELNSMEWVSYTIGHNFLHVFMVCYLSKDKDNFTFTFQYQLHLRYICWKVTAGELMRVLVQNYT